MKRLGLKYISSMGENFPAVNSGKWNLATNFKGNFNRILSESGIAGEDDGSVALYMRFIESGMLLCAARRFFPVGEDSPQARMLWMFVPDTVVISKEDLSKAAFELAGIFSHPEAFTSVEAFEDIIPAIFRKDFEETKSEETGPGEEEKAAEEAGKRLEREIFEAFIGEEKEKKEEKEEQARKMKGERIGYVGIDNINELEVVLSSGYIPRYSGFGLIFITDYPVRVEALLPGVIHPDLMLYRQIERERIREEEERMRLEEEARKEKEKPEESSESPVTETEEATAESPEVDNAGSPVASAPVEEKPEEISAVSGKEKEGEEAVADKESPGDDPALPDTLGDDGERSGRKERRAVKPNRSFSTPSFWAGVICASIVYLLIYIVVQVCSALKNL